MKLNDYSSNKKDKTAKPAAKRVIAAVLAVLTLFSVSMLTTGCTSTGIGNRKFERIVEEFKYNIDKLKYEINDKLVELGEYSKNINDILDACNIMM